MNIKINVRHNPEENEDNRYEAFAYTEGYGVKAYGSTIPKAMRKLRDKLKDMNKFSRIARTVLEQRLGYHVIDVAKIGKKLWTTEDTTNSKNG